MIISLLLVLASMSNAREVVFTKRVTPHVLQAELVAANFQVSDIGCGPDNKCVIRMPDSEAKDPAAIIAAHVYVDKQAIIAQRKGQLLALARKLRDEPANFTAQDRNAMLLLISFLVLSDE